MAFNTSRVDKVINMAANYKAREIPLSLATGGIIKMLKIRSLEKSALVMMELAKENPSKEEINKILNL